MNKQNIKTNTYQWKCMEDLRFHYFNDHVYIIVIVIVALVIVLIIIFIFTTYSLTMKFHRFYNVRTW